MSEPRISYPIAEAAQQVGVSERSLRDAIAKGDLVARYLGAKALIGHGELMAWFQSLPTERRRAS